MKFSIKDFFSKRGQIGKKTADLVTFTEESLNGKFHFLCSEGCETFDAKENVSMSWKSVLSKVAEWTAIILIDSIS